MISTIISKLFKRNKPDPKVQIYFTFWYKGTGILSDFCEEEFFLKSLMRNKYAKYVNETSESIQLFLRKKYLFSTKKYEENQDIISKISTQYTNDMALIDLDLIGNYEVIVTASISNYCYFFFKHGDVEGILKIRNDESHRDLINELYESHLKSY